MNNDNWDITFLESEIQRLEKRLVKLRANFLETQGDESLYGRAMNMKWALYRDVTFSLIQKYRAFLREGKK